jgi:hypothetical protein
MSPSGYPVHSPDRNESAVIEPEQAAFAAGPVAINLASRGPDRVPSVARGFGCRVSDDRMELTVFLSIPRARAVLQDLRSGAPVAVVLSRPRTHRSLQLKGERARVQALGPADRRLMRAYGRDFAAEIRSLGFSADFTRAIIAAVEDEAVAVTFQVAATFEQTPGPRAGERLGPRP